MRARSVGLIVALLVAAPLFAQAPPSYAPAQLDPLLARVALYPDPLLAQVLAAATFPDQIHDAARWADEHHYLIGQALASAIQADQLWWDPCVQALLPFPSVLEKMASNMIWTTDLGNAFLAQQQDVVDAVQRERHKAQEFGYLRSNGQIVVSTGPYITIIPADPALIAIPSYDPAIVFAAPRAGFVVANAIRFGFGVTVGGFRPYGWEMGKSDVIGGYFRPWGWGLTSFDWGAHTVVINNAPWHRTWANRNEYVHPYPDVRRVSAAEPAPERHELHPRSEHERAAAREGRAAEEEHRTGNKDRAVVAAPK